MYVCILCVCAVLGTMGEGMSLTVEERKRVAEAWMTQIADTLR